MPLCQGAGVELRYEEHGEGLPVLLIHGIADDATGWRGVAETLAEQARVIRYDRRGYGESGAPEPYERTTVEEQAEDAAALLRALDATPALVCGRDLGALACLDLLRRHGALVRAAVLVEPPLFAFVPDATEALARERELLASALRDDGPEAAVGAYLEAHGIDDEGRLERAPASYGAFFADYAGLATWAVGRRELRELSAELVIVDSDASPAHVRAAADALAALAPAARRDTTGDVLGAIRSLL